MPRRKRRPTLAPLDLSANIVLPQAGPKPAACASLAREQCAARAIGEGPDRCIVGQDGKCYADLTKMHADYNALKTTDFDAMRTHPWGDWELNKLMLPSEAGNPTAQRGTPAYTDLSQTAHPWLTDAQKQARSDHAESQRMGGGLDAVPLSFPSSGKCRPGGASRKRKPHRRRTARRRPMNALGSRRGKSRRQSRRGDAIRNRLKKQTRGGMRDSVSVKPQWPALSRILSLPKSL